jgi:fructan beta-fructosidase
MNPHQAIRQTIQPLSDPLSTGNGDGSRRDTAGPEQYRPAIHYTPRKNWINDPNGLLHHNGLFHLFYQYNPHSNVHANMSWGHASSTDLLNWEEHPVAIPCDEDEQIFSGSAVYDIHNSSGLGTSDNPPLVAIYTSAYTDASPLAGRQAQSLAYSLDGGTTWTKYRANPVLDRGSANFRDPKVFRHTHGEHSYWVMVAVEAEAHTVELYRSANLTDWTHLSSFGPANATGGVWECPDLFELPVDGDTRTTRWVLVVNLNPGGIAGGSGAQYFIGNFDGTNFTPENIITDNHDAGQDSLGEYGWLDWGRDYYAAVSYNDAPDGRRIMTGWMNNWDYAADVPHGPWRGAMTLPREINLTRHQDLIRPSQRVVPQIDDAFDAGETFSIGAPALLDGIQFLTNHDTEAPQRIDAVFTPGNANDVGLVVRGGNGHGTRIGYNTTTGRLYIDRTKSGDVAFNPLFPSIETVPVALVNGTLALRIYLDRSSVEVFTADGLATITDQIFPAKAAKELSAYAHGGTASLDNLTIGCLC